MTIASRLLRARNELVLLSAAAFTIVLAAPLVPGVSALNAAEYRRGEVIPVVDVTVYPLGKATGGPGTKPYGVCHPIPITVGGAPAGQIRVGIIEPRVSAAGAMWRAAAWQAALTASQLLDFNPQAMQARFTVDRPIDGPSAGALLTIGVISAVRGDKLKDDVTMTGTINPDGMIGPVGAIQYKLVGAAKEGKTTVLIPVHDRFEYNAETKKPVDLVAHGKSLGVKVIPVNDIWTAYSKFTGKELPRAAKAEFPAASEAITRHVVARIPVWSKLYKNGRDKYMSWPAKGHTPYADGQMAEADQFIIRANRLLDEGQFAAAYWDAVWAATVSWGAHEIGRYHYTYNLDGKAAAITLVHQDDWLKKRIETTAAAMRFFRPRTLEQLAVYLEACDAFFEGLGNYEVADLLRKQIPENDEEKATAYVAAIAEQHALSWVSMKLAREFLELADRYEGTPIPAKAPVYDLIKFYQRSGEAGMSMVNATEINPLVKRFRVSEETAQAQLALRDPDYAIANRTVEKLFPLLPKYFGNGEQLAYARLAAARSLYTRSAMLLAKYASLGVLLDRNFSVVGIRRERAVNEWLDDSQDQALRAIGALQKDGIDSSTCAQIYSVARIYEGREVADRVESLEYYFSTNVTAQILRHIAGVTGKQEIAQPAVKAPDLSPPSDSP